MNYDTTRVPDCQAPNRKNHLKNGGMVYNEPMNGFDRWLTGELNKRGWSNSELARRAGMVPSTVSMVRNGITAPSLDFCVKIAGALGLADVDVLRRAGLIKAIPPEASSEEEMIRLYRRLPPIQRKAALYMIRGLDAHQLPASVPRRTIIDDYTPPLPERALLVERLNRLWDVATQDQLEQLLSQLLGALTEDCSERKESRQIEME